MLERTGFALKDKLAPFLFVLSFSWVFLQTFFGPVFSNPFAAVVFLLLLALVVLCRRKIRGPFRRFLRWIALPKHLAPLSFVYCVLLIVVAQFLSTSIVDGTWDFPNLGRDAYTLASGESLSDKRTMYYARYPNNQLLLLLLSALFKIASFVHPHIGLNTCHHIAIGVNTLLLIFSIFLMYLIAEKIRGPEAGAMAVLLSMLFVPFWAFSSIYYSDIVPIPLMLGEVLLFLGLTPQSKIGNILRMLAIGILAGIAFQLKATTIFVAVALVFAWLLNRGLGKGANRICLSVGAFIVALLVYALIGHFAQLALEIDDELKDEYQFPYTHWVMMSLGETGGYNEEDVYLTHSAGNKEEKQAVNIEEIKQRLSERGVVGSLGHIFVTKVQRTWADGCFGSEDWVSRYPDYPSSVPYSLFAQDGALYPLVSLFAQVMWLALLLLLVVGGKGEASVRMGSSNLQKASLVNEQNVLFVAKAALLLFFFFELLWESSSRYVLHMSPWIILICSIRVCSWVSNGKQRYGTIEYSHK